ncbi:hypothetical protein EC991_004182 [Linnemannia zychae]|nr:hypothetical protein EC991_004182 [Linnemannia zychae]
MEYLMPLWLRQYITQRQKRGTSDPATLIEPRTISVQQSFYKILHPSYRSHAPSSSSTRTSKFPFSSTPSMFLAIGPRDLDTLNSQEIIRLAVYVMKRSTVELADPVLCEKIHTEGEKKRSAAGAAGESLKRGASSGSGRKGAPAASTNSNITASSIYLTKDFDIGNSVLHHRSKRPSRSLESVLSIATFCARASRPSASQEARRASGSSSSGGSDHGHGGASSDSLRGGSGGISRRTAGAGMVGARWLAKLGQVVFGGPCAHAGHSHHRRTKTSLEPLNSTTNSSNNNGGSSAPTEKLCKHCSGAMTCLAIAILREASAPTASSTNNILSSAIGRGKGNEALGRERGEAKNSTSGAATALHDSGFESGASGFEFLDAQSDNVASETSSTSSSSPPATSPQLPSSSAGVGEGSPRHGQSAFSAGRGGVSPGMSGDYRPQLKLKHETPIRPRRELGATSNMSRSPAGSGSPFIVFDKSHQNDTTIRHPLEADTDEYFLPHHDQVEEAEVGDDNGEWSPTSSILSDSIAQAFGPEVAAKGDYRSNMRSGMSTPRVMDLAEGGYDDSNDEDVPLGRRTRSRLERDLAEALGTPVLEPLSSSSSSSSSSPVATAQSAPAPTQRTAGTGAAAVVPLAPPSFRRPSITGLGIHAPTTLTNGDDSDDDNDEVFHQAIDHFIHPLSTSPHPRISPRTAPLAIPGTTPSTTITKSPVLEPSPSNYSSPPSSPITGAPSLETLTTTTDDVATPMLQPPSDDDRVEGNEVGGGEGVGSLNTRQLYGVGIHGRVSVDEYAQEVGESIQRSPPVGHSRSTVDADISGSESSDGDEQEEENQERVESATAGSDVEQEEEEEEKVEKKEEKEEKDEMTNPEKPSTTVNTTAAYNVDNDADAEAGDVEDDVMQVSTPPTSSQISDYHEEQPSVDERRPSTLRYGAVGLHALTPSDEYVQDIERSMQRTPPIDMSQPSDSENGDIEENDEVEKVEEEDLAPQDTTTVTTDTGSDNEGDVQDTSDIAPPTPQDATEPTTSNNEDEDEVQTDDEATNAATAVISAIDRIEDESTAAAEAKSQLAMALRYGAVGLHGKTPFDEYAHEIEESIQRRAGPDADVEEQDGESLASPVVVEEGTHEDDGGGAEAASEDREDLGSEKGDVGSGSENEVTFSQGHTNQSASPSITTNKINTSARPLSSVSTLGGESTVSDSSSLDYDMYDPDLDDLDANQTSPTTPQSATHRELPLRSQQRRRKRIQLVDDAKRKKEQLERIQAQLERRTLGKIREQVSFWETKGVLEQKVVGAEVLDDNDDDTGGGESKNKDKSEGDGGAAGAATAKKLQGLLLTQEHLRGVGSGRKIPGEPLSPGNSQSPGYGEMPQLAPRRSLPTSSSTSSSSQESTTGSSFPPSASEQSEMDLFLSDVD